MECRKVDFVSSHKLHLVMGLSKLMDKSRAGPAFCKSPSKPKPKDHGTSVHNTTLNHGS